MKLDESVLDAFDERYQPYKDFVYLPLSKAPKSKFVLDGLPYFYVASNALSYILREKSKGAKLKLYKINTLNNDFEEINVEKILCLA